MDRQKWEGLADTMADAVRTHIVERLSPIAAKQEAQVQVMNDLRERLDALEAAVARLTQRRAA